MTQQQAARCKCLTAAAAAAAAAAAEHTAASDQLIPTLPPFPPSLLPLAAALFISLAYSQQRQ